MEMQEKEKLGFSGKVHCYQQFQAGRAVSSRECWETSGKTDRCCSHLVHRCVETCGAFQTVTVMRATTDIQSIESKNVKHPVMPGTISHRELSHGITVNSTFPAPAEKH